MSGHNPVNDKSCQDLKNQGYKVDRLPADRQEFINELIEHATNDRSFMNDKLIKNSDGKMTFEEYQDFYQILPGSHSNDPCVPT